MTECPHSYVLFFFLTGYIHLICVMRCVGCLSLLMAPINHLFIWAVLSSGLTLSISLSLFLQWATVNLSCPVILINSVYLRAVIKENGLYNFNVSELRGWPRASFFSRLLDFSKFEQRNNKSSHISFGLFFYTLPLILRHELVSMCMQVD